MRVLLTNDDGIFAPGIKALYESLHNICDLYISAPENQRSASSHSITLNEPLRITKHNFIDNAYAVNGTPVDCIKIAIHEIMDKKPDLILSGINLGANTGINILYSGTAAAAIEGVLLGIPSIAFSLTTYSNPDFTPTADLAKNIVAIFKQEEIPKDLLLNINVPNTNKENIKDIVLTCQGSTKFIEKFDKRIDPTKKTYYWLSGGKTEFEGPDNTDERAIADSKISVTPMQYDMTDYSFFNKKQNTNKTKILNTLLEKIKEQYFII